MTGGNPAPLLSRLKDTSIKKLVLVSNVRQAQKAESLGADAVMAVGQEGGGHIGRDDLGTLVLIPRVVESVSIPVVASGGIGDGRGYLAAFALGAEGVEMGTRFIATKECVHAHPRYKQLIVEGSELDTLVIKRSLGAPGRVVKTPLAEKILACEAEGAAYEDLADWISGKANQALIYHGRLEEGFGWAGQVMGLIKDIPSVQELLDRIEKEARDYLARCNQMFDLEVR
jgi:NAD(P)H-dependent flavin oxidoreductase YrpB (nitropropane dioxygenase family)